MPKKPLNPLQGNAQDWSWPTIKAALEQAGHSLASLARENRFDNSFMTKAKLRPCARVERIIADALGVEPRAIWPSRYSEAGVPVIPREWRKKQMCADRKDQDAA